MPVSTLSLFQYSPTDGTWTPIPGFEGQLSANYWKEIFPPDAVCWWAVGWQNGEIVYYTWVQENACTGDIMMPGVIGELPGPPGPPGPSNTFPMGYLTSADLTPLPEGNSLVFPITTVIPTVDSVLISIISGVWESPRAVPDITLPNTLTIVALHDVSDIETPWAVTGVTANESVPFSGTFIGPIPSGTDLQLGYQIDATRGQANINLLNVVWQLIPATLLIQTTL
jgi:hypothetical protein